VDKKKLKRYLVGDFTVRRMISSVIFVYVSLATWAHFASNSMIFLPQAPSYKDGDEILKLQTSDGESISAVYLPNEEARFTILFSHGNAEDLGDVLPHLEELHALGFAVFAYDYHGYGTSTGKPTERNAYRDIEAAYAHVTGELGVPADRLIVFGRSVGCGPSTYLAAKYPIGGYAMQSPFVSAYRVLTRVPLFPFDKFPNLRRIRKVTCPVVVIHGVDDRIIPAWHGRKLYDRLAVAKRMIRVPDAGHNDLNAIAGARLGEGLLWLADTIGSQ